MMTMINRFGYLVWVEKVDVLRQACRIEHDDMITSLGLEVQSKEDIFLIEWLT